jgi:hypothetical protein
MTALTTGSGSPHVAVAARANGACRTPIARLDNCRSDPQLRLQASSGPAGQPSSPGASRISSCGPAGKPSTQLRPFSGENAVDCDVARTLTGGNHIAPQNAKAARPVPPGTGRNDDNSAVRCTDLWRQAGWTASNLSTTGSTAHASAGRFAFLRKRGQQSRLTKAPKFSVPAKPLGSNGEGGIRTPGRGISPYNGLANRRLKPLGHLSRDEDYVD